MTEIDKIPRRVRDAAVAAFEQREPGVPVLDLVADTLIDQASGTLGRMRRLQFEGNGCVAEVDVHGSRRLSLEVRLSPPDQATIEVRTTDVSGRVETQRRGRSPFSDVSPGLMSMLIRWPDVERRLARTAWVRL